MGSDSLEKVISKDGSSSKDDSVEDSSLVDESSQVDDSMLRSSSDELSIMNATDRSSSPIDFFSSEIDLVDSSSGVGLSTDEEPLVNLSVDASGSGSDSLETDNSIDISDDSSS